MAVALTGSPIQITSGSQSVSIPANCTCVVALKTTYTGYAVSSTLGGQSLTVDQNSNPQGVHGCVVISHLVNPPTGTQTYVSTLGYDTYLVCLIGVNTSSPVKSGNNVITPTNVTGLTFATGDMMLGAVNGYYSGTPIVTGSGQTQIWVDVGEGIGTAGAYELSVGGFSYTGITGTDGTAAAVVIAAASAANWLKNGYWQGRPTEIIPGV